VPHTAVRSFYAQQQCGTSGCRWRSSPQHQ
jgi:hypothetical protein